MYQNRLCSCECECSEVDSIQEGIMRIKQGVKAIQNGLDMICCCRINEGVKGIEKGYCKVKDGLDDVVYGLSDYEFECDYRRNMGIKEGVCDLKDGVKDVNKGLCELQNCCLCEGIDSVRDGLQDLEEGLCNLVKGINDIQDQREKRRKNKYCEANDDKRYQDLCGCMQNDN